MIREGLGDTEAKFFVPGHGFALELVEAKNHPLTPAEFWGEVGRFQALNRGSPGTYRRFTLVAPALSREVGPTVDGLRRIRDPHRFYGNATSINEQSFRDWVEVVRRAGHTEAEARFLFAKVVIEGDFAGAQSHGEALFRQALAEWLPDYQDLSSRLLGDIYAHLAALVRQRRAQPMGRQELEAALRDPVAPSQRPPVPPVTLHTAVASDDPGPGVRFDWTAFFGGQNRVYPPAEHWNSRLLDQLEQTRAWVVHDRGVRRIRLTGDRRLSATLAIGAAFSAVAGFTIEMCYRGQAWATDAFPTATTPAYALRPIRPTGCGERLVVSVGIMRDIADEVVAALPHLGLAGMPTLHLLGTEPITSPEQGNAVAGAVKRAIAEALQPTGAAQVDLFFAGPSPLALFLGHRLNATAPVQCYEWVRPGQYTPTCRLVSER